MKRDFYAYYTAVQKQYNDMVKVLEKVNKEVEEGKCTNEQRDNFVNYFNTIKCNYDRLSYVRHLLSLPPTFIQNAQKKKIAKQMEKDFKAMGADQESVILENQEALDNINKELSDE